MPNRLAIGFTTIIGLSLLVSNAGRADTIVAQRTHSTQRLIPLKKITVGPDDQYHGSVDPTGERLLFTKKTDLASHLVSQDIASGEVTNLLPLNADSQEAAVGPDGRIAFTYYKFNALGDICYRAPVQSKNEKITCLKSVEGEHSSPFWKSDFELGYVVQNPDTLRSQIIVDNLMTNRRTVMAEGKVFSPAMKPGGHYLFYNELVLTPTGYVRITVEKDLTTAATRTLEFALPGISGFPSVSDDEKYLYFSHYLNDTNHDNVIDGNDNSVVFRVPIDKLAVNQPIFPEQLTSAENNCSFPRPYRDEIFVTCAFEGYLDVYQIPTTGVVPTGWNDKTLASALQTSRTYEERILVLNTLRYRGKDADAGPILEKLLAEDLLADDTTAARYYLSTLKPAARQDRQDFYTLLDLYLGALEKKKAQASADEVTAEFRERIEATESKVSAVASQPRFKTIVRGLLRKLLVEPKAGLAFLKQVHFEQTPDPLERYYYFELAHWLLDKNKTAESLIDVYRMMVTAPELSEESKIYYAFHFLKENQKNHPQREDRIRRLVEFDHDLPAEISQLIRSEVSTLRIIAAPTDEAKKAEYQTFDTFLSASRNDYFLRKAIYVRSILNFAAAAEFQYLAFVVNNWLSYTNKADTEYAYAREVFMAATLDQAYDSFGKKSWQLAADYFYGSVTLTDDLESHYGYIRSMVNGNQRKTLDARYDNLKKRNFVQDNMKFVDAVLKLIDSNAVDGKERVSLYDFVIARLNAMDQDRDSPVRYLLLGYAYLEKMTLLANGYDIDHDLFESAHRNLMLAYDVGRENPRVQAAALMNLGILHQRAQNHALAAQFLSKRKEFGFVSTEERIQFEWFYARSLFYVHQADRAAVELGELFGKDRIPEAYRVPLLERRAFYLQNAGSYSEAARAYSLLLKNNELKGDLNRAKAYLSYGFSSFKLNRWAEASNALHRSLDYAANLREIPKGGERLVDFNPIRLQLDAQGLLAQLGSASEKLTALRARAALLAANPNLYEDQAALEIQNLLQMAQAYNATDPNLAAQKMRAALAIGVRMENTGQAASHAVFEVVSNYLVHGLMHPELYRGEFATVTSAVEKVLGSYRQAKKSQEWLAYQSAKVEMLWTAYSAKVIENEKVNAVEIRKIAQASTINESELIGLGDALLR